MVAEPTYYLESPQTDHIVEHREVAQTSSDTSSTHTADPRSPPLPQKARPLPSPARRNSNLPNDANPFRNPPRLGSNNPFAPKVTETLGPQSQDEDEDLQRALLLSQEPGMDVDRLASEAEEEERDRAARKVRTSGPPPSPTLPATTSHSPMIGPINEPMLGANTAATRDDGNEVSDHPMITCL